MTNAKVFISHKGNDKPWAERLARSLREGGIDAWLDKWEIQPGDSILGKIQEGISASQFMILVLTPESVAQSARWVAEEWQSFRTRQLGGDECRLLTVLLRTTEIPPILNTILYVDFRNEYQYNSGVHSLVKVMTGGGKPPVLGIDKNGEESRRKPYLEIVRRGTKASIKLSRAVPLEDVWPLTDAMRNSPKIREYGVFSHGHRTTFPGGVTELEFLSDFPIPEEVIMRLANNLGLDIADVLYESGEVRIEKAR